VKTNFVDQDSNTTFVIDKSGERWLFEDGHSFTSASGAAINSYYQTDVEIILEGHVETTSDDAFGAIDALGEHAMIVVTETGTIEAGHTGIAVHGEVTEIDNRGRIEGDLHGVYATGGRFYLSNMGYISGGNIGVYMGGDQSALTNHDVAEIRGSVVMGGAAGETLWFNNYGKLAAPTNAIIGGDSNDIIHNTGQVQGFVSLGAGNDVLDTRWGSLTVARIAGGAGDDLLITSRSDYQFNEAADQGYDTVKTNVSYALAANVEKLVLFGQADIDGTGNDSANTLIGNSVNNRLSGLGGDDILDGGRGNDVLMGGDGLDTFVFGSRHDMDTITDFTHGEDTIDLSAWRKVDSFIDFLKRAEDHGDDLWIIAGKDMLVIQDQHKADMHADDFTF
jgi:Ca2+-binding RTX toxin-like protein